jgi:hypothetical protein
MIRMICPPFLGAPFRHCAAPAVHGKAIPEEGAAERIGLALEFALTLGDHHLSVSTNGCYFCLRRVFLGDTREFLSIK